MTDYQPHPTAPPMMEHQKEWFEKTKDATIFAFFWEQRVRKARVIIDTAAYNYEKGIINALFIVAMPSGVPAEWLTQIEQWLPPRIPREVLLWNASKTGADSFKQKAQECLLSDKLAIFLVNGEAIITDAFRNFARKFLTKRKVLAVGDETSMIASRPGVKRAKMFITIGKQPGIVMKRILDGTPAADGGPLDLFAPMKFLDWRILGHETFASYRSHFAKWERLTTRDGRAYEKLIEYQNLDELAARLAPVSSRILFADVFTAPKPSYEFIDYAPSPEQQRVYTELRDRYETELSTGDRVTAAMVLVRYTRLSQVLSNFMPPVIQGAMCLGCDGAGCDACGDLGFVLGATDLVAVDARHHPRLRALEAYLKGNPGPTIVWSRFNRDVDDVLSVAQHLGIKAVRYDGKASRDEKESAKHAFQAGLADLVSAKVRSAGRGLPFYRAERMIYYSNTFSAKDRLQSESRAESAEKLTSTIIADVRARGTIDDLIVQAYREKQRLSDVIMREKTKGRWIV